jgi:hypothetical protein
MQCLMQIILLFVLEIQTIVWLVGIICEPQFLLRQLADCIVLIPQVGQLMIQLHVSQFLDKEKNVTSYYLPKR